MQSDIPYTAYYTITTQNPIVFINIKISLCIGKTVKQERK